MTQNTFGISSYQKQLIDCALDPDVSDRFHSGMTKAWAYRVTPVLNARTIRRAFGKLVARHDSLRLRFVQEKGQWRALIRPEHPTGVRFEDLGHLSDDDEWQAILAMGKHPMTALSDAMFEGVLIQSGARGSVLLFRAHHAIIDGYGISILMEDFLQFMFNIPVFSHAPSHKDFITLHTRKLTHNRAEKDTYWQGMLADLPPKPNLGCVARGLAPACAHRVDACGTFENILSPAQSRALDAKVKASGLSAYSYICAGYGEALCDAGAVDEVVMTTLVGRQDTALARYVGPDIQEFALRYRATPDDIAAGAAQVRDTLSDASEHLPYDAFHEPHHDIHERIHSTHTFTGGFFIVMSIPMTRSAGQNASNKIVDEAYNGKVSLGYMTVERIAFPFDALFSEMLLAVSQDDAGPNMSLNYQKRAYDRAEAEAFVQTLVQKLGV